MKYFAIDVGTYSIKTVLLKLERKNYTLLEANEYIIADYIKDAALKKNEEISEEEFTLYAQREMITEIVPKNFDGKIIWQIPSSYVISRQIELPVIQQKKLDMMIPFQLDENLPFATSDSHYFYHVEKVEKSSNILANITKKSTFIKYYNYYKEYNLLPTYLTSELSVFYSYTQNEKLNGPIAILDIGHKTSHCYLIKNSRIVDHHFSHCAGDTIDEIITKTYNISPEEASIYKHENCFFLTESQYDEVSEDQRSFALLMKKAMLPLAMEVKRWLLGFRVKYGESVETLYLTGGTAHIKNIDNFFAQSVSTQTKFLELPKNLMDMDGALIEKELDFFTSVLMAQGITSKTRPGNFLTGAYANSAGSDLPLYSMGMIFYRSSVLLIVFTLLFALENYLLSQRGKYLTKEIKTFISKPSLKINKKMLRNIEKNNEKISSLIRKKKKDIIQEIDFLKNSTKEDALSPFIKIFNLVTTDKDIILQSIKTTSSDANTIFLVKDSQKRKKLLSELKGHPLKDIKLSEKGNRITLSFKIE